MSNDLAGALVEVTYTCDPRRIEALDDLAAVRALSGEAAQAGAAEGLRCGSLAVYSHVVLGTERRSGRVVALLAAMDCRTTQEDFLLIDSPPLRMDARSRHLLRRMLAALVLRIAGLSQAPTVLASCSSDPAWPAVLHDFGRRFRGAACFPGGPDAPIQLRSGALARRVGRGLHPDLSLELTTGAMRGGPAGHRASAFEAHHFGTRCMERPGGACVMEEPALTLIDLRAETEAGITEDALKVYRSR